MRKTYSHGTLQAHFEPRSQLRDYHKSDVRRRNENLGYRLGDEKEEVGLDIGFRALMECFYLISKGYRIIINEWEKLESRNLQSKCPSELIENTREIDVQRRDLQLLAHRFEGILKFVKFGK